MRFWRWMESLYKDSHTNKPSRPSRWSVYSEWPAIPWHFWIKFGHNRMWKLWQFNRYFWQSIISLLYTKYVLTNSVFLFWQCCNVAMLFAIFCQKASFTLFQQQLKKGVVTLTIRTRLRSPSLTPIQSPNLLSRSSSPNSNSNTSGAMPVLTGLEEADGNKGPGPGPKDCIIMEVTLEKG